MVGATLYLASKFTAKAIPDLVLFVRYISALIALRYGYLELESASRPPCGFWRVDDQQLEN
jgi:hypothetical protein